VRLEKFERWDQVHGGDGGGQNEQKTTVHQRQYADGPGRPELWAGAPRGSEERQSSRRIRVVPAFPCLGGPTDQFGATPYLTACLRASSKPKGKPRTNLERPGACQRINKSAQKNTLRGIEKKPTPCRFGPQGSDVVPPLGGENAYPPCIKRGRNRLRE